MSQFRNPSVTPKRESKTIVKLYEIQGLYCILDKKTRRMTFFSIAGHAAGHKFVLVRNDEESVKKMEGLHGGPFINNNIIGQVGRVLKVSEDKSEVRIQFENGTIKWILTEFVESLSNYRFTNIYKRQLFELRVLVNRFKKNARREGAELSQFLEPVLKHFLFDVDAAISENGVTALHVASRNGDVNAVELLLQYKVSLEGKDDSGNRAVHYAAMGNRVAVMELLVSKDAQLDIANQHKQTPFHLAASGLNVDCLQVLMNNVPKLKVNSQDNEGNTALHLLILQFGLVRDEETRIKYRHTLEKMISLPRVKFLLENKRNRTVLQTAAEVGNLGALKCLLDCKGEYMLLNEKLFGSSCYKRPTALYYAIKAGHFKVVECLLEWYTTRRCIPVWKYRALYGNFPIRYYLPSIYLIKSIERAHYAVTELLVDFPMVDVNASDSNGNTALSVAVKKIGYPSKSIDCSASTIFKIYRHLKVHQPEYAEPALAVVHFLIVNGAEVSEEARGNNIVMTTLNRY